MKKILDFTIYFLLGIAVAITAFHVWFLYTLRAQVISQGAAISEIVDFINKSLQSSQTNVGGQSQTKQ